MQGKRGLTGAVGTWSARNPWKAIAGWIAFVVAAIVIGGAVGTNELRPSSRRGGERRCRADARQGGFKRSRASR